MLHRITVHLGIITTTLILAQTSGWAADNSAGPVATPTLGVTVTLPPLYEPTIQSVGALAATAATALKSYRSDVRTQSLRAALSKALLSAASPTISLDKANADPALGEVAMLCGPRAAYASAEIYQSYLDTLNQNIDAISNKVVADSTILDALKLLLASSSYAMTDSAGVDPKAAAAVGAKSKAACEADLKGYANDYYGIETPAAARPAALVAGGGEGAAGLAFPGPAGAALTTFIGVIQPVLTQAAGAVDQQRREQAIRSALVDNESKVADAGEQLSNAIDSYVAASRHRLAGAFVEQLLSVRTTPIDLSKVEDCKTAKAENRSPSGVPDPSFVGCWSAGWAKLQPQVDKLIATGESYDDFVDAGTMTAKQQFATIMANYKKIQAGDGAIPIPHVFDEITQFISFANAVSSAASKSHTDKLKSNAATVRLPQVSQVGDLASYIL